MRHPRVAALALVAGLAVATPAWAATVSSFGTIGNTAIGVTLDASGNVFVANYGDHTVSKVYPIGGAAGAPWPIGPFAGSTPFELVTDDSGNVYAANASGANSASKFTAAGAQAGAPWPVATGGNPTDIAIDDAGNVYTANASGNSVTKITPSGTATLFASLPPSSEPFALAFDRDGNLYTANKASDTVSKFTPAGAPAGAPWPVSLPTGSNPLGITVDSEGNVYTANYLINQVSRITPAGAVANFAVGMGPRAITVDSARNVYVTNDSSSTVSKITAAGTPTVSFVSGGGLSNPDGVAIDSGGNLYVPSYGTGVLSKITPAGGDIAPAPPARPAAPTATAGNATATVSVPANATDRRYGAPSSYTVAAVEDPSKTCTITPPATSCTLSGLANGTAYRFTARASLNAWETGASAASGAVTPSAPVTPPVPVRPKKLAGTFRLNKKTRVGTTTGAVPAGATVVVQTVGRGGGVTGGATSMATEGFVEMATAPKSTCRITTVRNKKTKKVTKRTYTCTVRLRKGTWTVTTTARGKAGVVAEGTRRIVVK